MNLTAWGLEMGDGVDLTKGYVQPGAAKGVATTSRTVCEWFGASWGEANHQNMNNLLTALVTWFEIGTTEGWPVIMYMMIDSRGIDMQPVRDTNPAWGAFPLLFLVVANFLLLNLFVGVVIENFNQLKRQHDGESILLTPEQNAWIKMQQMMLKVKPTHAKTGRAKGKGKLRKLCWHLSDDAGKYATQFEWAIMLVILLNTGTMALTEFGQSQSTTDLYRSMNYAFAVVFNVEMIVKFVGLGPKYYFKSGWNRFDFFINVAYDFGFL